MEAVDPPFPLPLYCEQLPDTSFTELTRSCCCLLISLEPGRDSAAAPPPALFCTVPLTSTFLPTREARSLEPPVSLYVVLDDVPLVAVGLCFSVGLAADDDPEASRMKPAEAELAGAPGAPGAALGDDVSAFRQPVTVTVPLLLRLVSWLVGDWLVGGWLVGDWLGGCD